MAGSDPVRMLCIYRVKEGKEREFIEHLRRHWPALRAAGLATDKPARAFRGGTKKGGSAIIEMFEWEDEGAAGKAHESPEVQNVWNPMGALCDGMEFLQVERLDL